MMNRYNSILQIALSAIFLLAGCEKADTAADSDARHTTLRVTTVPMTIVGEQVPYDTRASKPLNPEDENVIYSLAVLVLMRARECCTSLTRAANIINTSI